MWRRDSSHVYGDVRDIDLWVGGLAERKAAGSMLGQTFHALVVYRFRRNTRIRSELPEDVFRGQ